MYSNKPSAMNEAIEEITREQPNPNPTIQTLTHIPRYWNWGATTTHISWKNPQSSTLLPNLPLRQRVLNPQPTRHIPSPRQHPRQTVTSGTSRCSCRGCAGERGAGGSTGRATTAWAASWGHDIFVSPGDPAFWLHPGLLDRGVVDLAESGFAGEEGCYVFRGRGSS